MIFQSVILTSADMRWLINVYCGSSGFVLSTRMTIGLSTSNACSALNVKPVSQAQNSFCVCGLTRTSILVIPSCCLKNPTLMEDKLFAMMNKLSWLKNVKNQYSLVTIECEPQGLVLIIASTFTTREYCLSCMVTHQLTMSAHLIKHPPRCYWTYQ